MITSDETDFVLLSGTMADIKEQINAARREAEVLKERIKLKKDALADTSR